MTEPPSIGAMAGVAWWKRPAMRRALRALGHEAAFHGEARAAVRRAGRRGGAVGVWASREPEGLTAEAARAGVPVVRVEDGFLRSVGLGSDFVPAASLVFDDLGVYYDPTGESRLERILQHATMDAALLARARALREEVVRRGLTKYNVDRAAAAAPAPAGRRRVFVPGQVADDGSVLRGGAGVRGDLELLRRVRAAEPDAHVTYKPHPDVEAGHRPGGAPEAEALGLADRVVRGVSVLELFAEADVVHTLTSLCGFEALLRGVPVETHGQPFYSGWGLTRDHAPHVARRTRRLSLDMLVAGALILYPSYFDPLTGRTCGPETVIERLGQPAAFRTGPLTWLRRLQGRWMRAASA